MINRENSRPRELSTITQPIFGEFVNESMMKICNMDYYDFHENVQFGHTRRTLCSPIVHLS